MTDDVTFEVLRGTADELHGLELPSPLPRTVWVLEPTRPALVLGSTQRQVPVDLERCAQRGVDVVRRRSGGGAVLLVPGEVVWLDVLLPRGDRLWVDDVGRSSRWLGSTWVAALARLGEAAAVHAGAMACGRWGSLVCFAGAAPGEVVRRDADGSVPAHGGVPSKLVGISQRRSRHGARFQCLLHRAHDPAGVVDLLGPAVAPEDRDALVTHLARSVAVVDRPADEVVAAVAASLPADGTGSAGPGSGAPTPRSGH